MFLFASSIKNNHKIYERLNMERFSLEENDLERSEADKKIKEIDDFVENIYAKDIFEKYQKKRPQLVRKKDNQTVSWDEAFGDDFNKISKSHRHSLVGLIEGGGRYELK